MPSSRSIELASRARAIYDARLKATLEATNTNDFVAIEPDSGDYYVSDSLSVAIQAARAAHPDRLSFALRIGHPATVELGVILS